MKPKVKGQKLTKTKQELTEVKPESHVQPKLNEDTTAKQLKKEKLALLKLKKSGPVKKLLLQKKKKKIQAEEAVVPPATVKPETAVEKPKKEVPLKSEEKKLKLAKPTGIKVEKPPKTMLNPTKSFRDKLEPVLVRDPLLRAEIADYLRLRAACTVRVRRIPSRLRYRQIGQLCSSIQAYRVPWNNAAGRHKGVAFLEFATPEAAKQAATELSNSKTLGFHLKASVPCIDGSADSNADKDNENWKDAFAGNIDAYHCHRVVVSGLHPHTTGQELKDLVAGGAVMRVDFPHGSKLLNKNSPAVAFLTFSDERKAFEAIKKFQGHVIRNRPTSWMLHKQSDRSQHKRHPTQLVAFGVSKRVTQEDLSKAFPNSRSIEVRQGTGMAVISYADSTACGTDFAACQGGVIRIGKARLRVEQGIAQHIPAEQRKSESKQQLKKLRKLEQQKQQQARPKPQPKKPSNVDPSLFNKCQLIVKNFKPTTKEADFSKFFPGAKRVFFTGNRQLAFVHFFDEKSASEALEKVNQQHQLLNGAKLKAMYAMDKPDKKKSASATSSRPVEESMQVDDGKDALSAAAEAATSNAATDKKAKIRKLKRKAESSTKPAKKIRSAGKLQA